MVETVNINLRHVARGLSVPIRQVQAVVELLDEGNTIPFITRYRKDQTGGLDEEQIRKIQSRLTKMRLLADRKQTILRSIESQGKMTEELADKIKSAGTTKRLEDLYLPYKPKKQTLATAARSKGLEPLAIDILDAAPTCSDLDARVADFVNEDRGVPTSADALLGAGHILAELFSERAELRQRLREILQRTGKIATTRIGVDPKQSVDEKKAAVEAAPEPQPTESLTSADAENTSTVEGPAEPNTIAESDESVASMPEPVRKSTDDGQTDSANDQPECSTEPESADEGCESNPAAATTATEKEPQSPNEHNQPENATSTAQSSVAKKLTKAALRKQKAKEKKQKIEQKKQKAFSDYFDYSEEIRKIPPHRILAINRGERARVIRTKIELDQQAMLAVLDEAIVPPEHPQADFLRGCIRDSLNRLILPSLEREVRRELTDLAETHAVGVFAKNLRNLLLQPPIRGRRVLAVDPAFRSGCKLVALDQFGNVLEHDVVYLVGSEEKHKQAKKTIIDLMDRFKLTVAVIGNGTACRETEDFFAALINDELKNQDASYVIVNEAGASVYSTSSLGREEFPAYDATLRGAISIGRRLQDPLSELVKIDPANIGVGLYQHDIKAKHLKNSVDDVVESCVNYVGVDVNTASPALLRYVSGLNQLTAQRVYEYRLQNGPFRSREQLKNVPGFGDATFVQAAGFLKIVGPEPLDATWIHPESYETATKVLEILGGTTFDLVENGAAANLSEQVKSVNIDETSKTLNVGALSLKDLLAQLARPGRDPREDLPKPVFRHGILKMEDLSAGMELTGTVLNVVDFGAFVDIGMHDSGLVHVSQLADKFVRDPHGVVAVGDIVKVWVVEVEKERRRVSLTMIKPGTERSSQRKQGKNSDQKNQSDGAVKKHPVDGKRRSKTHGKGRQNNKGKRPMRPHFKPKKPPKPVVPITDEMKTGVEPMRTFSDLAQFFQAKRDETSEKDKNND